VLRDIEAIAGRPVRRRNAVRPLLDGTEAFGAMLELVESAEREILFENFIFRGDAVGGAFADELARRASRAVGVRVLHDPFGSLMSRRAPIGFRFHRSAVQVRVYNPPRPTAGFVRGGRDHRKLVVQDRARAVAGGLCLADAWLGNCVERCTWRDSAVIVTGDAAADAADAFETMWAAGVSFTPVTRASAGPESTPPEDDGAATTEREGNVPVRVLTDRRGQRKVERILCRVFAAARHEILITNPYVLPTEPLLAALEAAAGRGVTVELLVPLHGNHKVVALASEHGWGRLLRAGLRVWRWGGPMIHAKTVVVDRAWTLIGSSNLDRLSLVHNAELNFEIHGSAIGRAMAAAFTRDRRRATQLGLREWEARPRVRRAAGRLAAALGRWL
jgi:cardiolipin synthase